MRPQDRRNLKPRLETCSLKGSDVPATPGGGVSPPGKFARRPQELVPE